MEPQTILLCEESLYYGATSDLCSDMDGVQYPDECYEDDFSFHWSTVKGTESRSVRPSSPVYISWQTAHPSPTSGKGNTPLLDHRWKEDLQPSQKTDSLWTFTHPFCSTTVDPTLGASREAGASKERGFRITFSLRGAVSLMLGCPPYTETTF